MANAKKDNPAPEAEAQDPTVEVIVKHKNYYMMAQLPDQDSAKMQHVPKGTHLEMPYSHCKRKIESGKLVLAAEEPKKTAKAGSAKKKD